MQRPAARRGQMDAFDVMVPIECKDSKSAQEEDDISCMSTRAGKNRLTVEAIAGAGNVVRWGSPANSWAI